MTRFLSCLVPVYDRHQNPACRLNTNVLYPFQFVTLFLLFYVINPSSCSTKTRSFPCGPFVCKINRAVHEPTDTNHEAKTRDKPSIHVHNMHLSTTPFHVDNREEIYRWRSAGTPGRPMSCFSYNHVLVIVPFRRGACPASWTTVLRSQQWKNLVNPAPRVGDPTTQKRRRHPTVCPLLYSPRAKRGIMYRASDQIRSKCCTL